MAFRSRRDPAVGDGASQRVVTRPGLLSVLQTDGSGDSRRGNLVEGRGETLGAPRYRPAETEIACGPLTLEWSPCYSDRDHVQVVRRKRRVGPPGVIRAAVGEWSEVEEIEIANRYLFRTRGD
jgi:hypothetical protein